MFGVSALVMIAIFVVFGGLLVTAVAMERKRVRDTVQPPRRWRRPRRDQPGHRR